jgi:ribosomal subunit interface protein
MHIETAGRLMERSAELRGHAAQKLQTAFRFYTHRIVLVRVKLDARRGGKGSGESVCSIHITADRLERVAAEAAAADAFQAIDRAVARVFAEFRRALSGPRRPPRRGGVAVAREGSAAA